MRVRGGSGLWPYMMEAASLCPTIRQWAISIPAAYTRGWGLQASGYALEGPFINRAAISQCGVQAFGGKDLGICTGGPVSLSAAA
jgi:hypothetical protein